MASTICFGHQTALRILRTTDVQERPFLRSGSCALPGRMPGAYNLEQHIDLLKASHPSLAIERPAHILIANAAWRRPSSACFVHVCSARIKGSSLHRLDRNTLVSAAALAFVHIADQEESATSLLELAYELCGSYQTPRTGVPSGYQVEPLTTTRALKGFVSLNPSLRGAQKAARIMRYVSDGSASPRETKKALVLGLPMMHGGYGLGFPCMNYEVKASPAAQALTGKRSFRCDLCWPEAKLDVEYQSKESHAGETKRILDSRRTNALVAMGWTVICVTNDELDSLVATDAIAETIRRHLGKRPQIRVSGYHARKLKLRRQLGLPVGYD